jgi:hypothetical protein
MGKRVDCPEELAARVKHGYLDMETLTHGCCAFHAATNESRSA